MGVTSNGWQAALLGVNGSQVISYYYEAYYTLVNAGTWCVDQVLWSIFYMYLGANIVQSAAIYHTSPSYNFFPFKSSDFYHPI